MRASDRLEQLTWSASSPLALFREAADADVALGTSAVDGEAHGYRELADGAFAVAEGLRRCGVGAGDIVCWLAPPTVDAVSVWMGIAITGAIDLCVSEALKGRVLEHVLQDSGARVVVGRAHELQNFLALPGRGEVTHVLVLDGDLPPSGSTVARLSEQRIVADWSEVEMPAPQALASIIYTSGTTGPSKGVMLSHFQQLFIGATFAEQFRLGSDDRMYHYSPYHHISGRQVIIAALLAGASLVARDRFTPTTFWHDVEHFGCTHAVALGSAVPVLLDTKTDQSSAGALRYLWASPAMPTTFAAFTEAFGVRVLVPYGSTEVGIVTAPPVDPVAGQDGNSGRFNPDFELRIVDEDDREVAVGAVGEIVVRARRPWTTFLGYWNLPEVSIETNRNGWYHTGDYGRVSADDYLFFVDRKKDFLRTRGENVSSSELEEVIVANDTVSECAVVPVPSDMGESDVLAVVVASQRAEVDPEVLFRWCVEALPYYMVPRYIRVVTELPRTHSGKVEKYRLRAEGAAAGTWDSTSLGMRVSRSGLVAIRARSGPAAESGGVEDSESAEVAR